MPPPAVYFFCDHIYDTVPFRGLAERIRARASERRLVAIVDRSPNIARYERRLYADAFDEIHEVGYCSYGGIRALVEAWRVRRDLRRIPFAPGSVLFISSGRFLVSQIVLRRLRGLGITTVWLTSRDNKALEDVVYDPLASGVFNAYNALFGVAAVDAYRTRGSGRERLRAIQFRRNPYDVTLFLAPPRSAPAPDQWSYPFFVGRRLATGGPGTVLVCGNQFTDRPWIDRPRFVETFNRCLDAIRTLHPDHRLVYVPHPRERASNREGLALAGFVVDETHGSDHLLAHDGTIAAVYSPWSTVVRTAESFGIRSYWLYRLFAGASLDAVYATHLDAKYAGAARPKFIEDMAAWQAGAHAYEPDAAIEASRIDTDRLLDRILTPRGAAPVVP